MLKHADYEGLTPRTQDTNLCNMHYKEFITLPLEARKKIFYRFQADYGVVKALIKDRNEFKTLYYILLRQLINNGIKPDVLYLKSDIEDIQNGKIL